MSRDKNAVEYLPGYMAELFEMQELYKGLQPELDLMYRIKDSSMEECFVLTCEGFGLERYEEMLGITPLPTDTIDDRRLRVLAALNGDTPYTFERIYAKLKVLCGEDNVTMEYAKDIYTLRVLVQLAAKNQIDTVNRMLRQMLPCNISLICSLAYNRHSDLAPYKHSHLAQYTHLKLREEVL